MSDCKIVSVRVSPLYDMFRKVRQYKDGSTDVEVFDSPELERALSPYFKEGYRIVQAIKLDGAYTTFILERN